MHGDARFGPRLDHGCEAGFFVDVDHGDMGEIACVVVAHRNQRGDLAAASRDQQIAAMDRDAENSREGRLRRLILGQR